MHCFERGVETIIWLVGNQLNEMKPLGLKGTDWKLETGLMFGELLQTHIARQIQKSVGAALWTRAIFPA
jgi:hypothetical protein